MPKRRPRQTNTKPKLVKDGFRIDKIVDKIDLSETEHKQVRPNVEQKLDGTVDGP